MATSLRVPVLSSGTGMGGKAQDALGVRPAAPLDLRKPGNALPAPLSKRASLSAGMRVRAAAEARCP